MEAFEGQDVVICTLNDEAAVLQEGMVKAAYEASVKRFLPNEWANHDMCLPGTGLEGVKEGKRAVVDLLDIKVKEAQRGGKDFHVSVGSMHQPVPVSAASASLKRVLE